ncbi:helix-turn-helix domain-containing protein [Streptococcus sp. NLN64]|uniref:helix-turn-helix domain-containing protein n=2 Tax=unclassified Streptococcus TaxID=2608887 RepID=UPI0018C998AD|nr:helix-turn-helix domain-containing protein [Streptococcus sp. NLN64]MBG9367905.1 transposase [Streptococcus sp. NLN64]
MSRKSKISFEDKLKAVTQYIEGKASSSELALQYGVDCSTIRKWIKMYQSQGPEGLQSTKHNQSYTTEFKLSCVEAYKLGEGSLLEIASKFGLRSPYQLRQWIIKYNSHQELKDYNPIPEVYEMASRKTTKEERLEIVQYCLNHDSNYKETARKFGCSYAQVYSWCRKYKLDGLEGLTDNRGRKRSEDELSELEKANRRIKELERRLEISEKESEFLKKVRELERSWLQDNLNNE